MTQIKTKRTYDPEERSDGFRVLIDRLWPRGLSKEEFHYDLWEKDIAPSTELREWYHENEDAHWSEFEKRYTKELETNPAMSAFIDKIRSKSMVTLLYSAKNTEENNALVLQAYLENKLG